MIEQPYLDVSRFADGDPDTVLTTDAQLDLHEALHGLPVPPMTVDWDRLLRAAMTDDSVEQYLGLLPSETSADEQAVSEPPEAASEEPGLATALRDGTPPSLFPWAELPPLPPVRDNHSDDDWPEF